jgi:hypothetical protein
MHSRFRGSEGRPGEQDAFAGRLCDILSAGSRAVGRRQSRMGMPAGTRARARLHVMYARMKVADLEDRLPRDKAECFVVLFTSNVRGARGEVSVLARTFQHAVMWCAVSVRQSCLNSRMPVSFQTINDRCRTDSDFV